MGTEFDLYNEIGMDDGTAEDLSLDGTGAEELPEEASEPEETEEQDESEGGDDEDAGGEEEAEGEDATGELRSMLRDMHAELQELRAQLAESKAEKTAPVEPTEIDFVDEEMFDKAVSSREGLNKLLNIVHQAGHASAMQLLPSLVEETAGKIFSQKMLVESFYRSNPDLDKIRPVVQAVAKEVSAEMPNEKDYKKVLLEIAKRARARVGGGKGGKATSTRHTNPGNVSSGSGRPGSGRPVKKKSTVADDIQKMLDS